jgi:hypothetical protein
MDHTRLRLEPCVRELGRSAPRELLREAGFEGADPRRVTITVEGFAFASLILCGCARHRSLGRFVPTGSADGACPSCGQPQSPHPMHSYTEVPMKALAGQLDRPLGSLGARSPSSVRLRHDSGAVLFHRRFARAGAQR